MTPSSPPPELSYAQIQARWQGVITAQFSQEDLFLLLGATHLDFAKGSFLRTLGHILIQDALTPSRPTPIDLESITNWPMTTRIDGIMPLKIPLASDIGLIASWWLREMNTLGFDLPELDRMDQVEDDIGLCLFACLHQRCLRSSYGMTIELTTQCPSSAHATKHELCVMGLLPNGSRITVFYSVLKSAECLTMSARSLEHFDALEARRLDNGDLMLHGLDLPDDA